MVGLNVRLLKTTRALFNFFSFTLRKFLCPNQNKIIPTHSSFPRFTHPDAHSDEYFSSFLLNITEGPSEDPNTLLGIWRFFLVLLKTLNIEKFNVCLKKRELTS